MKRISKRNLSVSKNLVYDTKNLVRTTCGFLWTTEYSMFIYRHTLKLHETDAAGLLFFSHQFTILHDAYEALLEKIGYSFARMLKKTDFFLPIVHAESDYKHPLFVGDRLMIEVRIGQIGTTSFSFLYSVRNEQKKIVGSGKTVHVTINKKTGKKIPLPASLQRALKQWV